MTRSRRSSGRKVEERLEVFLADADSDSLAEELASTLCSGFDLLKDKTSIRESELTVRDARKFLRQSEDVISVIDIRIGTSIPVAAVESLRTVDNILKHSAKLIPLFNNINAIIENCCQLHELLPEQDGAPVSDETAKQIRDTKVDILIAVGTLFVEVLLIQFSITYRLSFAGTRLITNRLLVHIRKWIPLSLYAGLLKEVHWYLRGELAEMVTDTVKFVGRITERIIEMEGCDVFLKTFENDDITDIREASTVSEIADDGWFTEFRESILPQSDASESQGRLPC